MITRISFMLFRLDQMSHPRDEIMIGSTKNAASSFSCSPNCPEQEAQNCSKSPIRVCFENAGQELAHLTLLASKYFCPVLIPWSRLWKQSAFLLKFQVLGIPQFSTCPLFTAFWQAAGREEIPDHWYCKHQSAFQLYRKSSLLETCSSTTLSQY